MRRLFLVAVAAPMFAVAGCSGSPSTGESPSPTPPEPVATASSSTPTATPQSATPVTNCLKDATVWFDSLASVTRGPSAPARRRCHSHLRQ